MIFLLTGAGGFIGREVCRALLTAGHQVRAVTSSATTQNALRLELPERSGLDEVQMGHDALSPADWQAACDGVEVVIHLGARAHVLREDGDDRDSLYHRANCEATMALASAAGRAGVRRFVFVSSIGVHGPASGTTPFSEGSRLQPHSPYARSKLEAERGLQQLAADQGQELVIIRPPLVYGPHAPGNFGALSRWVRRGWPLPLGAVHNQRSLISRGNLVDFILNCCSHFQAAGQTFLVSDGADLSTTELLRGMARAAGVQLRLLPAPVWALQAAGRCLGRSELVLRLCGNLQLDMSKAREMLAWVPPLSVEEGLKQAMDPAA
jgi:nucleoside-diphosphate-sugar epimerase